MTDLVKQFHSRYVVISQKKLDESETYRGLFKVVVSAPMFTTGHLLVWNSFKCHISDAMKAEMKTIEIENGHHPREMYKVYASPICVMM